jgi:two-component system sensor histidine kinase KdpD
MGVRLGLAFSLGLTEAMQGTLETEETPGGSLTMVVSLPATLSPAVHVNSGFAAW